MSPSKRGYEVARTARHRAIVVGRALATVGRRERDRTSGAQAPRGLKHPFRILMVVAATEYKLKYQDSGSATCGR